jgi:hypothetical protein
LINVIVKTAAARVRASRLRRGGSALPGQKARLPGTA